MSDINLGDVVARLRFDTGDFARQIQAVLQQLQQFQTTLRSGAQQQTQQAQAFQQQAQALGALQQRVVQSTTSLAQLNSVQAANAQSTAQMATAFRSLSVAATQAAQQLQTIQAATQQTHQAMQQARQSSAGWQQALQIAGGVGLATSIQAIVSSLMQFARASVDVGTRMEALRTSLGALAGSAPAGVQQFNRLFETAQRLGVAFEPLARGFRQLTAAATQAGLPLADQFRLLEALATEGRRVGASQEELGRAITAIGQIASKGVVSMEELRQQLGEALPTAMAAAARGMGRTTEELDKLISTGSVRFPAFARALTRGFEDMQRTGQTVADGSREAFARLGNAMTAFQTALGQNIIPELQRLAGIAQTILETATKILNVTGGRTGGPVGPTPQDLGATEAQQRELNRLESLIRRYEQQGTVGTPVMQEARAGMLERARQQRDELLQVIRMQQDQTAEQAKITAEATKTAAAHDLTRDYLADIAKQQEVIRKTQDTLRREAQMAPELYGRPGGTLAEQERFQKELQQRIRPQVEALTTLISRPPAGVTIPSDVQAQLRQQLAAYGEIQKALDAIKEKEDAIRRATREDEALRRKAIEDNARLVRQAEQERERATMQLPGLETQLEQLQAFGAIATQSLAEQARTRIEVEGARLQAAAQKAIEVIRQNPFLPQDLTAQFEQALTGLPDLVAQKSQQAFDAIDTALRDQVRKTGDQIDQLTQRITDAGLSPMDAALARIRREFAAMLNQMEQTRAALEALRVGATAGRQGEIDAELEALELAMSRIPAARDAALREQRERPGTEELTRLRQELQRLQAQRDERMGLGRQQRVERAGMTEDQQTEAQALLAQIEAQERLNYTIALFESLAGSVGQAWTQSLMSVAQGTQTVAQAFRSMVQSLLLSLAQLASQEAWKALIRLGVGLIAGAATGGITANPNQYASPIGPELAPLGGGGASGALPYLQHGGFVNRPTVAMVGEAGPEWVLNRQQMQTLMTRSIRGGPSAGGQAMGGQGVTVMNFPSREAAEQERGREEALGKRVVMNEVMSDLRSGEASQIMRMVRTLQR